MPKQKSKRALRKRVRLTGSGRLRRYHAYKSHILTKKHPKRKRHLRKAALDRLFRGLPQLGTPAKVALGELHDLVLALQARDVALDAGHESLLTPSTGA